MAQDNSIDKEMSDLDKEIEAKVDQYARKARTHGAAEHHQRRGHFLRRRALAKQLNRGDQDHEDPGPLQGDGHVRPPGQPARLTGNRFRCNPEINHGNGQQEPPEPPDPWAQVFPLLVVPELLER